MQLKFVVKYVTTNLSYTLGIVIICVVQAVDHSV